MMGKFEHYQSKNMPRKSEKGKKRDERSEKRRERKLRVTWKKERKEEFERRDKIR
jgi:hypothetical protein